MEEYQLPIPEEYADFMAGYRAGFPLDGEELPDQPEQPSEMYQQGLAAGQRDYVPGIAFEK